MLEIQKKLNEEIKEKENNFKSEEKLQYQLEEADKKYMDYKKEQPVLKTPVRKRRRPMTPGRRPLTRSMQKTGKFNKEFQLKNSLANIEEKDEYQRRKLQEKEHELKYNELYEQKIQLDDKLRNMLEIQKKLNEEIKEKENNFKSEEKLQYQQEQTEKLNYQS